MILDITFCSARRCLKKIDCYRWTKNLFKMAEKQKINLEGRRISVAEFSTIDGSDCKRFVPLEEKLK